MTLIIPVPVRHLPPSSQSSNRIPVEKEETSDRTPRLGPATSPPPSETSFPLDLLKEALVSNPLLLRPPCPASDEELIVRPCVICKPYLGRFPEVVYSFFSPRTPFLLTPVPSRRAFEGRRRSEHPCEESYPLRPPLRSVREVGAFLVVRLFPRLPKRPGFRVKTVRFVTPREVRSHRRRHSLLLIPWTEYPPNDTSVGIVSPVVHLEFLTPKSVTPAVPSMESFDILQLSSYYDLLLL